MIQHFRSGIQLAKKDSKVLVSLNKKKHNSNRWCLL